MIEEYLNQIDAEYYKTSEYNNWLANLDNECNAYKVCWQEYCWQSLHADEHMFLARSKQDAICYLLQDPEGNVLCDRYERYIRMMLYKAVNEQDPHKQLPFIKGLPKDDAAFLLACYHHKADNLICVQAIINRYCVNTPIDNYSRNKAKPLINFVRGVTQEEKDMELRRIKEEICNMGFIRAKCNAKDFGAYLAKQFCRNDGKGLLPGITATALSELTQKKETATRNILSAAKKCMADKYHHQLI